MLVQENGKPLFAIGDIHGCARELQLLLTQLPLVKDSTLIFLGDYIDRGSQSREVIDTLLSLREQYNVITLKGNHESMFIDFLSDPESHAGGMFIMNGGASTLASYGNDDGNYLIPKAHIEFLVSLPVFAEDHNHFFVHAGVPRIPLSKINLKKHETIMLWTRDRFLNADYDWGKRIVHGHTLVREPQVRPNRIGIDTGCVYNGLLTAVELPALNFHSVRKAIPNETRIHLRDKKSNRVATRFDGAIAVFIDRDKIELPFETLNFNEFGLLARPLDESIKLAVGETIQGRIGNQNHNQLRFNGTVMRVEQRDTSALYGVKFEKVWDPANEAD